MIISESHHFIFIHNPKCAGTSMRVALKEFDTRANFYWGLTQLDNQKIDKAHLPLNILRRFQRADFNLLSKYFVFGFVRNPYERAVSSFNEQHAMLYKRLQTGEVEMPEYTLKLNTFIQNLTALNVNGWHIPQRHFVRQKDMFWLENKCHADLIIKLEDLNKSLDLIGHFLPNVRDCLFNDFKKKRNTKPLKMDYLDLLTPESIKTINNIYKNDFLIFDYPMIKSS